jgi:hypothetical protein
MVRSLRDIFFRTQAYTPEKCWEGLEFEDLAVGDRYISLPIPGDNSKPGSGFKSTYSLFQKIQSVKKDNDNLYNSIELNKGRLTLTPSTIPVIKIK